MSKTTNIILAVAAVGVGAYYLRPRKASAEMRDPKKLLPSKQLPRKQPPDDPFGPIVEPDPSSEQRVLEETSEVGPMTLSIYRQPDGSYSYLCQLNAFIERYRGQGASFASGFPSLVAARSEGRTCGSAIKDREMLRNDMTPTGREVAYWDYHWGVEMQHIADPLSLTGVGIHWFLYSPGDELIADGTADSEPSAVDQLNAAMFADEVSQ